MRFKSSWFTALVIALLVFAITLCPVLATDETEAGRRIVAESQDAIVTIQLVITTTTSWGGEEGRQSEDKADTTGVIIDPTGLVVTSLSSANPSDAIADMADEDSHYSVKSDVTDVKILMGNGREIPAKIVLRDRDLDLAFLRPKDPLAEPLPSIDFTKSARLDVLDQVLALYRLGTVASRSIAVSLDRVQSVVERPRTFYIPGAQAMSASLGSAVFALDGTPAGLLLLRTTSSGASGMAFFGGISQMGIAYIILPPEDIMEVARQAPQDAPEEI